MFLKGRFKMNKVFSNKLKNHSNLQAHTFYKNYVTSHDSLNMIQSKIEKQSTDFQVTLF